MPRIAALASEDDKDNEDREDEDEDEDDDEETFAIPFSVEVLDEVESKDILQLFYVSNIKGVDLIYEMHSVLHFAEIDKFVTFLESGAI